MRQGQRSQGSGTGSEVTKEWDRVRGHKGVRQGQRSQENGKGPEVTGEWVRARGHREGYGVGSEVTGKGMGWGQRSQGRV